MTTRKPKHPCPKCNCSGRQTDNHKLTQYFQCSVCEFRWSERYTGGQTLVSYRVTVVRH